MNDSLITPKPNLCLRRIGSRYMIVDVDTNCANLTHVYCMNGTAAWLWQSVNQSPCTLDDLVDGLCRTYAVDPAQARADIKRQLDEWNRLELLL